MKTFVLAALGALALFSTEVESSVRFQNKQIISRDSNGWMGTSLYYLPGLSDEDQDAYIAKLADLGAKVVRLWINRQSQGCQKGSKLVVDVPALEDTIGQYNDETLDAVDKSILKLSEKGIKAIISPHDANSLLGDYRKDIYYETYGAGSFYTQQKAFDAYDARLSHILNYKGAHSGKVWKEWSSAIMAFNLQNEPFVAAGDLCKNGDTAGWSCGRATHMREELGSNSSIIITTGGLGGDFSHGCTLISAATDCSAIDAIALHRYASVPGGWSGSLDGWVSDAKGKLFYLEEWGIDSQKNDQASAMASEVKDMNSAGLPNVYWQILPAMNDGCSYKPSDDTGDPFGIYIDSGVDLASAMSGAASSSAKQDWSGIVY